MKKLPYRKNSAGILWDGENILLVRRPNFAFWEFVQGGVEIGETSEEAIKREICEEVGITKFKIIKKLKDSFQWDWPIEMQKTKGFQGQKQTFFLVEVYPNQNVQIDKKELEEFKWIHIEELNQITKYPVELICNIINELHLLKEDLPSKCNKKV